ncbi:MAG: cyanate transporter, partial [Chloroflexota bacterium]
MNPPSQSPVGPSPAGLDHDSRPGPPVRVLAALFLVALALRPQILVVGPLLIDIQRDLGISHGVAGLLGTIPVLCMGLFAPVGAILAASVGSRAAVAACVLTIATAGLLRSVVPGAPLV